MCRKLTDQCKAKVKCKWCVKPVDSEKENDKLSLNEVDNQLEQQHYLIEVKGE